MPDDEKKDDRFVTGILLGVAGAFVGGALFFIYKTYRQTKANEEAAQVMQAQGYGIEGEAPAPEPEYSGPLMLKRPAGTGALDYYARRAARRDEFAQRLGDATWRTEP